jgi:hypothetical protein
MLRYSYLLSLSIEFLTMSEPLKKVHVVEGVAADVFRALRDWMNREKRYSVVEDPITSMDNCPVRATHRSQVTNWIFKMVDFCQYSRETAEIAVSLVDRASSIEPIWLEEIRHSRILAVTCLYSAVKFNETEVLSLEDASLVSNGVCSVREIEMMERHLLLYLVDWTVNKPTCMTFVYLFLDILPSSPGLNECTPDILHIVKLQCYAAIRSNQFVLVPASAIAFSALLNSLEVLDQPALAQELCQLLRVHGIYIEHSEQICMYLLHLIANDSDCIVT